MNDSTLARPRHPYLLPDPEGVLKPERLLYGGYIWVLREDGLYHDLLGRRTQGTEGYAYRPRSLGWFVEHGYQPYPTTVA